MRSLLLALVGAATLISCGKPGAPGEARVDGVDVCARVGDATAVFGRAMESEQDAKLDAIAGGCRWRAADGVVIGDAILFTADSVRGDPEAATPQAMFDKLAASLEPLSDAAVEPVADLGDKAVRTVDTFGDQTQVLVLKGDTVLLVRAASADPKLAGPALAEKLAKALTAS